MTRARIVLRNSGFTLIELLVVISIIGVLIALALPSVQAAREAARRSQCQNNLMQLGLALQAYENAMSSLPIGYIASKNPSPLVTAPGWGWTVSILPQLEQSPLYNALNINLPTDRADNSTARTAALGICLCPSDRETGLFGVSVPGVGRVEAQTTSYAANHGSGAVSSGDPDLGNGLFLRNRVVRMRDIRDGTSTTFALGERGSVFVRNAWAGVLGDGRGGLETLAGVGSSPLNKPGATPEAFFSPHSNGIHFVMADGSVRLIKTTINQATYRSLATRSARETIGDF
jgi:prepilin-type N-terminal cleavage/methylation domain-containing protein/prepilin-type processing-associated H-X9-DG protein